jgi:hypothetical protein
VNAERHIPQVYTARGAAWVVCACGWQSKHHVSQHQAQMAWSAHVRDVLLAKKQDAPL